MLKNSSTGFFPANSESDTGPPAAEGNVNVGACSPTRAGPLLTANGSGAVREHALRTSVVSSTVVVMNTQDRTLGRIAVSFNSVV
jgi:hypothetical protein